MFIYILPYFFCKGSNYLGKSQIITRKNIVNHLFYTFQHAFDCIIDKAIHCIKEV